MNNEVNHNHVPIGDVAGQVTPPRGPLVNAGCERPGQVHPAHVKLVLALQMAVAACEAFEEEQDEHDCVERRPGSGCNACELLRDCQGLSWALDGWLSLIDGQLVASGNLGPRMKAMAVAVDEMVAAAVEKCPEEEASGERQRRFYAEWGVMPARATAAAAPKPNPFYTD
jgi:hypothetical protein